MKLFQKTYGILFSHGFAVASVQQDSLRTILERISPPTFNDATYSVIDYGAVADGATNSLVAFRSAIQACNLAKGGTVLVPPGVYYHAGPLDLLSDVHLKLADGATIRFSPDPADYLPPTLTKFEGTELYNYSPLVRSYMSTNVAITGEGSGSVIDGNGAAVFATWKDLQADDQEALRAMGNDSVPVYERVFGGGHFLRPNMIEFLGCANVLVEGVKIVDSPFWVIHPVDSTNVIVRRVVVDSMNTNNDGCDPEGSVDVLIEGCDFNTGDDGIAIKSGRDADGWRVAQPTKNVVIRGNRLRSATNGICVGSEMSGGVSNVIALDNVMPATGAAIYFKSNLDRGSYIEDVVVSNLTAGVVDTFLSITNDYHSYRGGDFPTLFRNFTIKDSVCDQAGIGISAIGLYEMPIQDVILKNVDISNARTPYEIEGAVGFQMLNVTINGVMQECCSDE